jgi:hypothetical protein
MLLQDYVPQPVPLKWLLDSDPAIRWQVMKDLTDEAPDAIAAERARVVSEGWGARLLALQGEDGQWEGGACFPMPRINWRAENQGQPWTATLPTLQLLCDFGVDPRSERVRQAVALVKEHCRWEHAGQPFFSGEVEPCINGRTVTLGTYFNEDMDGVVVRLIGEQLEDGGWNCEAENGSVRSSFATTISCSESWPGARAPARWSTQLGCNFRFRVDGITTCCVLWTTSARLGKCRIRG